MFNSHFRSKKFSQNAKIGGYQRLAQKYPFIFIGIPFFAAVIGGTYILVPMQETRYEIRDSRAKELKQDEQLKVKKARRKIDLQEEYWRLQESGDWGDWENKRVQRANPEDEPVFDRQPSSSTSPASK
ncbi:Cytochrome oxidase assembly [Mycoemilia scoparia]|uniref:Cytochrome c oxidase assembly protein COX16, mitochondrial n=1 Tax=Mycoemilia scoparia TaxID=417184 RepID=A0A9W8A2Q2_9FUNG|nr:Cytochrome oxidase assembly [Mycoemilia scoparia]